MPIYRCNACGYVSEDTNEPVGKKQGCGRCGHPSTVYGTVFFVEKLVERYAAAMRELKVLRASEEEAPEEEAEGENLSEVDINNTNHFATAEQHQPLREWFSCHKLEAKFDYSRVDTTGFFDNAAEMIGDRLDLFGPLLGQIAYAYRKEHGRVSFNLAKRPQKEAATINKACRELYSHALFSKYYYQKSEKIVRLTLQSAPKARRFFEGEWLEWFAFVQVLRTLQSSGVNGASCARGVEVRFQNEDLHELDVVVLPSAESKPVFIECKSGEFRGDIEKYLRIRKRIELPARHFLLCASNIDDTQAQSLSAMYDLTFVSPDTLAERLAPLLRPTR